MHEKNVKHYQSLRTCWLKPHWATIANPLKKLTLKKKNLLTISSAVNDVVKLEFSHTLVEMKDGTATLESSGAGSDKVKNILTIFIQAISKWTPYLPKNPNLYMSIYWSTIHNCQKCGTV